jgi:uncharacterized phage protein gp47/JayE
MSGTVSPTSAYVDATGIHAPTFSVIQQYLIGQFQAIHGADIVVSNDSQDGQMIGVFAAALNDTNAACVAVYNSFSPSTAQGVGLSSMVKINGLARHVPSNSTAALYLVGEAGTVITNGIVQDPASNNWRLPASVTIPPSGDITVTATCQTLGAVSAAPGDIAHIYTVTLGWQTATNPAAATPGAPVESDPLLRIRQAVSTALPALSVLSGMIGAVAGLPGVTAVKGYENDTNTDYSPPNPPPPANLAEGPLPPHSISLVVQGGDAIQICQTILLKKTPGCYTYGSTRETVDDVYGLPHDIGFFIPSVVTIGVHITLKALAGYSTIIGAAISQSVSDYINALGSGESVIYSKLWMPANLCTESGAPIGATGTYDIIAMAIGTPPDNVGFAGYGTTNIAISIFQMASCLPSNVIITVSP